MFEDSIDLKVYEPSVGLGSYAIDGRTEDAYKPTLNAMYTYNNSLFPLSPYIEGVEDNGQLTTDATFTDDVLATFTWDGDRNEYNVVKMSVMLWLEGWDADYFVGLRETAISVKLGFEIEEFSMEQPPQFPAPKHTIYIDADKMEFPVLVRAWEKGDTFVPFGMNGKQKVSDLFNNLKINRLKKKQIPIVLIGDKVAWVVGIRADHRFRITTQTQHYYKITYHGTI